MRELSLHILDVVENSIRAGATSIAIFIEEDEQADRLTIGIQDNGEGMDEEFVKRVLDPFVTSRTTRRVGLGLSLFAAAARRCEGDLTIESQRGKGTTVTAVFRRSHIDRAPLGDLRGTLVGLMVANQQIDFTYTHVIDGRQFVLDTREIKAELGDISISNPAVLNWLGDYLDENLAELGVRPY
ncbi:MAG: ATP-binding protein [Chloroflexi bacterium]|nr:ATP-binding protein [Chloroflexota bacterium]